VFTQTVSVVDNTPPVLSGVPDDLQVDCTAPVSKPVVTAIDACSEFTNRINSAGCFAIADEGPGGGAGAGLPDALFFLNPDGTAILIGFTGTVNIESTTFDPNTGTLYAMDAGVFGSVNIQTGAFTPIGPVGTGNGADGAVTFADLDGLTFDNTVAPPVVLATERRNAGEPDPPAPSSPGTLAAMITRSSARSPPMRTMSMTSPSIPAPAFFTESSMVVEMKPSTTW